jgi:hypothetical protein
LKAVETQRQAKERHTWKLALTRRLYEKGLQRRDIVNLFRFIDWVMQLPPDLDSHFWQQMRQYEEERRMPYISTIERIAAEQGLALGLQQGALRQLLLVLVHRFGTISNQIQVELHQCTFEQLQRAQEVALTVSTLDEFARYLKNLHSPTSN